MWWRIGAFLLAALLGIVLFAVGGAWHSSLAQLAGVALEVACLVAGWRWFARQPRPPGQ